MTHKRRIFIDQDSTIYDLSSPWYAAHNKDYPQHNLRIEDVNGWDTSAQCRKNDCPADIYSYFNDPSIWSNGAIIDGAKEVIDHWHSQNIADLGILTTAANGMSMPHKLKWIHNNFPYIKDVIMVNTHLKHLVRGDILIDDGLHNLKHWEGISILYTQPWNIEAVDVLRAIGDTDKDKWDHIDWLVRRSLVLLDEGLEHKEVEWVLISEQNIRGK